MKLQKLMHYQQHFEKLAKKLFSLQRKDKLEQAMAYLFLNGGKRLRPLLVYSAGKLFHAPVEKLNKAALAVECIHVYSLLHDDLPAMDNDDYRRGKLSCHKVYGEDIAILAGDALQSLAFQILSENNDITHIKLLAQAIGNAGMVKGQVLDMQYKNKKPSQKKLMEIHHLKTGALITASLQLGALCGKASKKEFNLLTQYAENFGLAFQLRDDLLDGEHHVLNSKQIKLKIHACRKASKVYLNKISTVLPNAKKILIELEEMIYADC